MTPSSATQTGTLSRRDLFRLGTLGAGMLCMPRLSFGDAPVVDRFFLNLVFPGGLDPTYFFDSRPRSMTAAEQVLNFWEEDAVVLKGRNGNTTLRSTLTNPLKPHFGDLTVLNGVHMIASFDGHPQNMNYLFTGSAFGGDSFLPHLNRAAKRAMDVIETGSGFLGAEIANADASIPLSAASAAQFAQRLGGAPAVDPESALGRHLERRFAEQSNGDGGFNHAALKFRAANRSMPQLASRIQSIDLSDVNLGEDTESILTSMALIREVFRAGIAGSATWVFGGGQMPPNLDTHDAQSAAKMPEVAAAIVQDLASVFKFLKETAYDGSRSLFDVTTVMVSTEFARTRRQTYTDFAKSGNDHNPLNNSIILAGSGIKGGLVFGESDLRSVDEVKAGVKGAHKQLDAEAIKPMGRPFEFETGTVSAAHAETYRVDDYLTINSVVNSLYDLFGVDSATFRSNERNGRKARIIPGLLRAN